MDSMELLKLNELCSRTIKISKDVHQHLSILKAEENLRSFDSAISWLIATNVENKR